MYPLFPRIVGISGTVCPNVVHGVTREMVFLWISVIRTHACIVFSNLKDWKIRGKQWKTVSDIKTVHKSLQQSGADCSVTVIMAKCSVRAVKDLPSANTWRYFLATGTTDWVEYLQWIWAIMFSQQLKKSLQTGCDNSMCLDKLEN